MTRRRLNPLVLWAAIAALFIEGAWWLMWREPRWIKTGGRV